MSRLSDLSYLSYLRNMLKSTQPSTPAMVSNITVFMLTICQIRTSPGRTLTVTLSELIRTDLSQIFPHHDLLHWPGCQEWRSHRGQLCHGLVQVSLSSGRLSRNETQDESYKGKRSRLNISPVKKLNFQALELIRQNRNIRPNAGFLQQLADLENTLLKREHW